MPDKLEWKDIALMKYIAIIESIYIPDFTEYKYYMNVVRLEATEEELKELMETPFGATICMRIFKDRYNEDSIIKKFTYKDYLKNSDIQNLIQYLELDVDKFWF